jgi:hypothetical protein
VPAEGVTAAVAEPVDHLANLAVRGEAVSHQPPEARLW